VSLRDLVWAEKYRPRNLEEMLGREEIVSKLKTFATTKNMPHLLFVGPPGTSKTTAALALVNNIYNGNPSGNYIELNASDERGIEVVRIRIKEFAKSIPMVEVPFRVIILDESDNMCLHPDTRVTVGTLDDPHVTTLNELRKSQGDRWFDIPSLNLGKLKPENDKGRIVESGTADLCEIVLEDHRVILASPEHPFFVIRGRKAEIVRTKELVPGSTKIADFSNKFLTCYGCGRIFYREDPSELYERDFCSVDCRNTFFGSLSRERTPEQKRRIAEKAHQAFKDKGVYRSDSYRRKRSEIAKRLIRTGRLKLVPSPSGYWKGRKLSEEHKRAIGEGFRRTLIEHPEIRENISQGSRKGLARSEKYRNLVKEGFFKRLSYKAWEASVEAWKKKGFRSSTEERMSKLLDSWGIPYRREYIRVIDADGGKRYTTSVDFAIGDKTALFVNGCWWHSCPECYGQPEYPSQVANVRKDELIQRELQKRGYKTIIVWEHELTDAASIESIRERVYETIGVSGHKPPGVKHVVAVRQVRYLGRHEVLNITMMKNRNFFLANGILTHNTSDAQQALRRTLERYSENTRFILIANELYKIIEPIQSRCSVFRFGPMRDEIILQRLNYIAEKEGVRCDEDALKMIVERADGDMRMAINLTQGIAASQKRVDTKVAREFLGLYGVDRVDELIDLGISGDFSAALDLLSKTIHESGVQPKDVVRRFHRRISSMDISPESKMSLLSLLAETEYRLMVGADPEIQFTLVLAKLSQLKGSR